MGLPQPKMEPRFTYADYLTWPHDERWELIDGRPWAKAPAPTPRHQLIVGELFARIHAHLRGQPCRAYLSPIDVRLPQRGPADDEVDTVVQPDLIVVCDPGKLRDGRGCLGAPDWIIEVTSLSTALRDAKVKRALYERHGVPEYWIVHPEDRTVTVYRHSEAWGGYGKPDVYGSGERCAPAAFPQLWIDLDELWAAAA